jgi:hypothetical protein
MAAVISRGALPPAEPLAPWKIAADSHDTELLKTYASRNRLERVEQSLQAYYLDRGSMPESLQALASGGYLPLADLVDPWGRAYAYRVDPAAFEIASHGPGGEIRDDLVIRHPFSASQRMVLEGKQEQERPGPEAHDGVSPLRAHSRRVARPPA